MDPGHRALDVQRRGRAPLSLNARQIGELCGELAPLLRGLRLRDVQPLPPRDCLLVFEGPEEGRVRRLYLSANADASRLHLQQGRLQVQPHPPGPFYTRVAAELSGAELTALEQVARDRIVRIEFRDDQRRRAALVCELVGRHSNLCLVDGDDVLLSVLVPPPKNVQGGPRLAVGKPWRSPGGTPPEHSTLPSVEDDYPEPDEPPPGKRPDHAPRSWRVESTLSTEARDRREDSLRKDLVARLNRKAKRARARIAGLEARLVAVDGAERVQQDGELLKAALGTLKRGMKSIELQDWFSGEGASARTIELDPKLSPQQNVERTFERYRKLVRARETLPQERAEAEARLARIEELLELARADDCDHEKLDRDAQSQGILDKKQVADPRKRRAPPPRLPYRVFHTRRGSEIRVGRSARDNDALSTRLSRGNDMWFHTADAPGSHVVLCLEGRKDAEEDELLDAMHLAVHFSPLKSATKAAVHVARCKEVHKPRGAKPGLVTLSGGRNVVVRMQPERLERLLADRRPPASDPADA